MTEENRCKNIRYVDFINLFHVENLDNWFESVVRKDGVWVKPLPDDPPLLFPETEGVPLVKHPTNDPTTPAFKFPCSYVEVQSYLKHANDQLMSYIGPESESGFWTITGGELLRRWGVDADIIAQLVLDYGLPVCDQITRGIFNIASHKTPCENHCFEDYFREGPFYRFLFRPSDIDDFENQNKPVIEELKKRSSHLMDSGRAGDETEKAVESTDSVNSLPQPLEPVNFFTRENGDYWRIGFEGRNAPFKHCDGLLYISHLLKKPGESISCKDLYQAASGKTPDKVMSPDKVLYSEDQELHLLGSSKQAVSDDKARQKYSEEYKKLNNDFLQINNLPDNERTPEHELVAKETEEKMALLMPYLKERTFPDKNMKRFQVNIQKRLNTAYKAIGDADMKKMAKHLRAHIRTDGALGLSYTGTLAWEIIIK